MSILFADKEIEKSFCDCEITLSVDIADTSLSAQSRLFLIKADSVEE